jgi:hypothetical protein
MKWQDAARTAASGPTTIIRQSTHQNASITHPYANVRTLLPGAPTRHRNSRGMDAWPAPARTTPRLAMVHTMTSLDAKQKHLMTSWIGLADRTGMDAYTQFMALWIAFNAYCCAHYAQAAHRERADVRKSRGLDGLTDEEQPVSGTIRRSNNRVTIDLESPSTIRIVIAEKYTEDHIFTAFAEQHADTYHLLLQDDAFRDGVLRVQQSLEKRAGNYYVINMAKARHHDENADLRAMEAANIIIRFTDTNSLRQLKDVLYQVRCNIFHGEKQPGILNDDRIVTAATPVLRQLLGALVKEDCQ